MTAADRLQMRWVDAQRVSALVDGFRPSGTDPKVCFVNRHDGLYLFLPQEMRHTHATLYRDPVQHWVLSSTAQRGSPSGFQRAA